MNRYAKLIDGKLIAAPQRVEVDGSVIFNPMPDTLLTLGYKEVVYPAPEEIDPEAPPVEPMPTREVYTEDEAHIYVSYEAAEPAPDTRTYEERVEALIRKQYSVSDELAILRQRDVKPDEFNIYNTFCETCKNTVRDEMANNIE